MPASEIDDIFSGVASSSKAVISEPVVKKKKGSKKRKAERETEARPDLVPVKNVSSGKVKEKTDEPKKKKIAETVVDPSKIIEARVAKKRKGTTASQKLNEEDEDFRDTRGKNRSRTEDGYLIYSAEELQIDENSGGTPLCPFDCDCCH